MDDGITKALTRGVESILPDIDSLSQLMKKRRITLYQGFDPSMPSLHLGNLVGIMKLKQFQDLGHKVVFLVGDFTGMIGDPTDKLATRKQLTRKEVKQNSEKWKGQVSKLLKFGGKNAAEIKFNSEWLDKITFKDLIEITSNFTVQQLIERDMYQIRLTQNRPIHLHEFLYPVAQGYDSVAMGVDLEIGGTDQIFNMLAGRTLMKNISNKEKFVLSTKLLVDKNGNKVGKTTGNALFLDSKPEEFFGGIMSFPDDVIELSFELLTEVGLDGINDKIKNDPLGEKKRLAFEVVKMLWGNSDAKKALAYFENTFQDKKTPEKPLEIKISSDKTITDLVGNYLGSKSEAKRLIIQGAVDINGVTIKDTGQKIKGEEIIRIGKKTFLRVKHD